MARASYSLQKYAYSPIESSNGTTYTMDLWWDGSGGSNEWTLGPSGIQISYETEDADDKNSPILTSTCTIPLMVENLTQEVFINGIRTTKQERDVWITIRRGTLGAFIWSGYILMDLEVREDVSYPYETTLKAVDGLASLKDMPFIRETNSDTAAVPSFPYVRTDTWDNAGFQRVIGTSASWIVKLLDNAGQLLATDDASGILENYTIQTAFNWWNEDMGVSPAADEDPLYNIKLSMRPFYKESSDGYYDVPNCYDVLKSFCKNFNMRLIYWENTFHFIGLDEYNSNENTTYTGAAFVPSNIPTRTYFYSGSPKTDINYLGTTEYSLYKQIFENVTAPAEGLQKLAGSQYQALPPIKKVIGEYLENAGQNSYNGFPLFLTHNSVAGLTTSWPTGSGIHEFIQQPQENGVYKIMEFTDAKDLNGFVCQIICDFTNTSSAWLTMESCFSMRAKPSTGTSWTTAGNKVLKNVSGTLGWYEVETGIPSGGATPTTMLVNKLEYLRPQTSALVSNNANSATAVIFNSNNSVLTTNTNNLIPTHADFAGQWDFQFFTYTKFQASSVYQMGYTSSTPTQGRVVNHGTTGTLNIGGTIYSNANYDGSTTLNKKVPTAYALDYVDTMDQNLSQPYLGTFIPMKDDQFGISRQKIEINQSGNDSFIYNIGSTMWGDGSGQNTFSTIQVYDGANWVYVNSSGKWAKGVYTWGGSSFTYATPTFNKKILTLLCEQIMYNQSIPTLTLSTNTALSEINKEYPSSTRLKFMNPIARLEDLDGNKYIMKRGTFTLNLDQWQSDMMQMSYNIPSITSGTRNIRTEG
tara:strand:- start:1600 stop:4029 length:2430 start_codon:yes stop_codon:yes gene_type:complete